MGIVLTSKSVLEDFDREVVNVDRNFLLGSLLAQTVGQQWSLLHELVKARLA